jgi:hypothetical protein
MSLTTKKITAVTLGAAFILTASFAFATPAKAQTIAELQALVQSLMAQIAALSGGSSTAGSGAGCYAFTMTHQMGDTGGEVMEIQKFLNSHGAQIAATGAGSPGNESSYFGALTRAAVAKWQAANGVSPAAGYWGPVTRAKVAQVCASMPGTTPGTTPGSTGLQGTAGSAVFTATSEDVEDTVQTGSTERVGAFKIEAQGSDIRATSVRVTFTKTTSGSATDYLTAYFSEISLWANGQKIGSMPASSFTRDSAGVYSAVIPVDQIVRMGSSNKVLFHVGATAQTSVDSDDISAGNTWGLTVTQVRYTDASGAVLFDNPNSQSVGANTGIEVERLSQSSDVVLRMAEGSGNPKAGNVEVNESNSTEITIQEFTLRAENADMTFDQLVATTTLTGVDAMNDMVQTLYLMRGNTRVAEFTPTSTTPVSAAPITFELDDLESLSMGSTQTYRVVAKVNQIGSSSTDATTFGPSDTIKVETSPSTANINARASDGKLVTERRGSSTSYTQTLFADGVMVTKVGESFISNADPNTTANSTGEFKVTLRVTAFGSEDVYIPLNAATSSAYSSSATAGTIFTMQDSTGTAAPNVVNSASLVRVSGGTELASSVRISAGQSADFQLTVTFNPSTAGTAQYRVQVWSVGASTADDTSAESQTATVPVENFRSAFYTVQS